jgi:hypothetical protein
MAMRILLLLGLIIALTAKQSQGQCLSGDSATGWPWNTLNVKIYVHYDPSVGSGPGMGLRYALNMSQIDVEYAVIRTVNILNEEVGGKIKLQYSGTTTSTTDITGAIVLRSANPDCSNAASGYLKALAHANAVGFAGFRLRGRVSFFRKHSDECNPIAFTLQESGDDVIAILIHELGHVFYDVGHSDSPSPGCAVASNVMSIMRSAGAAQNGPWGPALPRWRVIKDLDRFRFQQSHGVRGPHASLHRSYRYPLAWSFPQQVPDTVGWKFHYRPGSLPQNVNDRNLGSLINVSSTPQPGGGGIPHIGRYATGSFVNQSTSSESTMMRPVAVAARSGSQEVLVVYAKRAFGTYGVDSDVGRICYRRSLDAGVTYGAETCEAGNAWHVWRSGLTAAYSLRGDVFLVGYIGTGESMRIGFVPASGSSFPPGFSAVVGFDKSWHAPAVACRDQAPSQSSNCLIVWEDKTNVGCRTTQAASVNPVGSIQFLSSSNSPCLPLYDTPGLAHNHSTDRYELLVTSKNDAIYSYIAVPDNLSWAGHGDVWNSTNSFVLSGVVGYRAGLANRLQAVFVKYH